MASRKKAADDSQPCDLWSGTALSPSKKSPLGDARRAASPLADLVEAVESLSPKERRKLFKPPIPEERRLRDAARKLLALCELAGVRTEAAKASLRARLHSKGVV